MHRFRLSLDVCRFAEGRAKYTHVSKVFQFDRDCPEKSLMDELI